MDTNPESTINAIQLTSTSSSPQSTTTVIVRSENSRVITNGTLIGTLISNGSQPSLTIQVNQDVDHISSTINCENDDKNSSSGVSIVNCYRAVPAQIDDSCVVNQVIELSNNNETKSASDNNLDAIKVDTSDQQHQEINNLTSIETQTIDHQLGIDNKPVVLSQNEYIAREQRRRERRGRRTARRPPPPMHPHHHPHQIALSNITQSHNNHHPHPIHFHPHPNIPQHAIQQPFEIIPDLLNSHYPPPYSTLPAAPGPIVPSIVSAVNVGAPEDIRYAFSIPVIRR